MVNDTSNEGDPLVVPWGILTHLQTLHDATADLRRQLDRTGASLRSDR